MLQPRHRDWNFTRWYSLRCSTPSSFTRGDENRRRNKTLILSEGFSPRWIHQGRYQVATTICAILQLRSGLVVSFGLCLFEQDCLQRELRFRTNTYPYVSLASQHYANSCMCGVISRLVRSQLSMALFARGDQQPRVIPYRFELCVVRMMQALKGISLLALQIYQ